MPFAKSQKAFTSLRGACEYADESYSTVIKHMQKEDAYLFKMNKSLFSFALKSNTILHGSITRCELIKIKGRQNNAKPKSHE